MMTEGVAKVYLHQCLAFVTVGVRVRQAKSMQIVPLSKHRRQRNLSVSLKSVLPFLTNEFHCSMTLFKQKGLIGIARDGLWIEIHGFDSDKCTGISILAIEFRRCVMIYPFSYADCFGSSFYVGL
jgi:hypothetical protein